MPQIDAIRIRRGTAALWTSTNPVLNLGEPGYETDTGFLKIGDGVTAWASLDYFSASAEGLVPESAKATEAEAEAGTNNTQWMTPLRVMQLIDALGLTGGGITTGILTEGGDYLVTQGGDYLVQE